MHRWIASILAAATMVFAASAQTLYIPAAANAEGVNQTQWRTDLQVKAMGGAPASFSVELLESRQDNGEPQTVEHTIDANQSLRLNNLLDSEFGFSGTAALRVTASEGGILVNSRTYNDDPAGTYGQTVPAVAESGGISFGDIATLIQLSRSPDPSTGFRANIGFVNLVDAQSTIEIDFFAADGTPLGSLSRTLKPFEHRQLNDIFNLVGADDVEDGYATVRTTTEDGRFIAYASVVDNGSGDAVFILPLNDDTISPVLDRLVVFESFMRPG